MRYLGGLRDLSDATLRVLLLLSDLAEDNPSYNLTLDELARQARVAVTDVAPALSHLEEQGVIERSPTRILRVGDQACNLKFTSKRDRQIETMEEQIRELTERVRELEDGTYSGLASKLGNDHASVIRTAESTVGRALYSNEIFYLGQLVGAFATPRVIKTLQTQRNAKNPLKATYAILMKGGKGKKFEREPSDTERVEYFKPDTTYKPW